MCSLRGTSVEHKEHSFSCTPSLGAAACHVRYARRVVLVAEDDENDAELVSRAFRRVDPDAVVTIVENGSEAVRYLQAAGRYSDRREFPFPHLLVTDIKMPMMDGFELLGWLKAHMPCSHSHHRVVRLKPASGRVQSVRTRRARLFSQAVRLHAPGETDRAQPELLAGSRDPAH
jgi:CheY-like chemotaxis protein